MSSDSALDGRRERKQDTLGEFTVLYSVKESLGDGSDNRSGGLLNNTKCSSFENQEAIDIFHLETLFSATLSDEEDKVISRNFMETQAAPGSSSTIQQV